MYILHFNHDNGTIALCGACINAFEMCNILRKVLPASLSLEFNPLIYDLEEKNHVAINFGEGMWIVHRIPSGTLYNTILSF